MTKRGGAHKPIPDKIKLFRGKLLRWYASNARSFPWRGKGITLYQAIIAEVLLQRTRAETIRHFYPAFLKKYPGWSRLSAEPRAKLKSFLKPIGLSQQKSVLLKSLAVAMGSKTKRVSLTREQLEALPGVGQYIANAVLSVYYGEREPLLDVNMARVLERYFGPRKLADIRYDPYLQKLAHDILPRARTREFNWATLDFAATRCKASRPFCAGCIFLSDCSWVKNKTKWKGFGDNTNESSKSEQRK